MPVIGRDDRPVPAPIEKAKPASETRKESTKRSRTLFVAGKNLEKLGKKDGAILFYQQTVKECRGTPDADQAIALLRKLGGRVPEESESVPPKEADPWTPPKRVHYASTEAAGREIDRMIAEGMQAAIRASNTPAYSGFGRGVGGGSGASHLCGAPTLNGTPCMNRVSGPGYCYLHQ
jgi:hypothetical protein